MQPESHRLMWKKWNRKAQKTQPPKPAQTTQERSNIQTARTVLLIAKAHHPLV